MKLDASTARKIAVEADVDPRTVLRVFRGEAASTMARRRARAALQRAGFLPAEPPGDGAERKTP